LWLQRTALQGGLQTAWRLLRGEQTHFEDDISVLVLAEEIDLTLNPHIKTVCLPSSEGARPDELWYA
jgi:hypothetical protein